MQKFIIRSLLDWLPLGVAVTLLSALIYLAVQQETRLTANDPQIQISEDLAARLSKGDATVLTGLSGRVDMASSLAPYTMVFDNTGKLLNSEVELNGNVPPVPAGVFDDVKRTGQARFTWQPQAGVRAAAVVTYFSGQKPGFVLAARSMREIEKREDLLLKDIALGWALTMAATLFMVGLVRLARQKIIDRESA